MEKSDTSIIEDKKKVIIITKQDLIEQQLGNQMLIEDFGKDNIVFLE